MAAQKRGLGRGLGALIPTDATSVVENNNVQTSENLSSVPGITFAEIELNKIKPNTKQPRQVFEEEALK